MRQLTEIIIHCTANSANSRITVADIDRYHRTERGFNCIGYHYVVDQQGTVWRGRFIGEPGAHCRGHNKQSIGIAYIGGLDRRGKPKDTRTSEQIKTIGLLCAFLRHQYGGQLAIHGHHEYARKPCPCFDVQRDMEQYPNFYYADPWEAYNQLHFEGRVYTSPAPLSPAHRRGGAGGGVSNIKEPRHTG